MNSQSVLSALVCAVLAGCSAAPAVIEVSPSAATAEFPGVPLRIKAEQSVAVWKLMDNGRYEQVSVSKQTLADYKRLYAIDVTSYPFASPSLHIAANPDNTLKSMQVTGTNQSAGAVDALSGTVAGISKAQSDKTAARVAGAKAAQEADKIVKKPRKRYRSFRPILATSYGRPIRRTSMRQSGRQTKSEAVEPTVVPVVRCGANCQ